MKRLIVLILAAGLPFSVAYAVSAVTASHPSYALGSAKKCKTDYVKKTERHDVTVVVKGKKIVESQRYVACVYVAPKKPPVPVPVSSSTPVTTPIATTPPITTPAGNTGTPTPAGVPTPTTPVVTTPAPTTPPASSSGGGGGSTTTPPPVLTVNLDPSFVQSPNNPLAVTYTFSASASVNGSPEQSLPSGVLDFYSDGLQECSINVGASVTSGQCSVTYSGFGNHSVVTEYLSGGQTATTGTETEDITSFATTTSLGTVSVSNNAIDMSNWAYSQVSVPVTISGITTSLGTTGTVSLTDGVGTVEQCTQLSNHPNLGTATATCTADIEDDPNVATNWTPSVNFTGDSNYQSSIGIGSVTNIPVAPAPTINDVTVELQCAESGGFCTEYASSPETTGADANVYAGPEYDDLSPQVGTVTFTSADHILICTATVYSAAGLPSNNARCTGTGGPYEGPIQVAYSGGTTTTGDVAETVYSSATTSGGSN